jgi:hypothetical protein
MNSRNIDISVFKLVNDTDSDVVMRRGSSVTRVQLG